MAVMTRKRRRMMEEATAESLNTILPKEVMIEILSRVDSSNTLQLRCVCKLWNLLVLDPQFAKNRIKESCTEISVLLVKASKSIKLFKPTIHRPQSLMNAASQWDYHGEAKNLMMKEVAQLDKLVVFVRYFKVKLKTGLRVDLQILEDRLKCLKSFLKVYHKSATPSSSQL